MAGVNDYAPTHILWYTQEQHGLLWALIWAAMHPSLLGWTTSENQLASDGWVPAGTSPPLPSKPTELPCQLHLHRAKPHLSKTMSQLRYEEGVISIHLEPVSLDFSLQHTNQLAASASSCFSWTRSRVGKRAVQSARILSSACWVKDLTCVLVPHQDVDQYGQHFADVAND